MIIGYGNYTLTFAISGSGPNDAAFLTSSGNMNDGRTGLVCSASWISGAQTTASYVDITVTVSDPLDSTAALGVVGLANVVGLPEGLILTVGGVNQALVANDLGELGAWWLPGSTGNSFVIRIKNDNGSTHPVLASATFGIGEIFVGRAISLPTLTASGEPSSGLEDPTAFNRQDAGSLFQAMRRPWGTVAHTLGMFTTAQAVGGTSSTLSSGGNPAGVIDLRRLRGLLSTGICAVCDFPSAGVGGGSVANGIRYSQSFMQANWMVARLQSPGAISMSKQPYFSWAPTFMKVA